MYSWLLAGGSGREGGWLLSLAFGSIERDGVSEGWIQKWMRAREKI
jgi:hypothetical protein